MPAVRVMFGLTRIPAGQMPNTVGGRHVRSFRAPRPCRGAAFRLTTRMCFVWTHDAGGDGVSMGEAFYCYFHFP